MVALEDRAPGQQGRDEVVMLIEHLQQWSRDPSRLASGRGRRVLGRAGKAPQVHMEAFRVGRGTASGTNRALDAALHDARDVALEGLEGASLTRDSL